jgi:hypothetical protein
MSKAKLIPIWQVGRFLPFEVSTSSVRRWCKDGVRGHRLESVVIGGRRFVRVEAIKKFLAHGIPEEETAGV